MDKKKIVEYLVSEYNKHEFLAELDGRLSKELGTPRASHYEHAGAAKAILGVLAVMRVNYSFTRRGYGVLKPFYVNHLEAKSE